MNKTTPSELHHDSGFVDSDNPWPGLVPYSEADREFFLGRSSEIDRILSRVKRKRLAVLYAASGVGKSSLLEAGLFPQLRLENYLPISIRMNFSNNCATHTDQALTQITRIAELSSAEAPKKESSDSLWEYFHRPTANFWSARNRLLIPVLVFDQFEEFFTLGRNDAQRANASSYFLGELGDLAEGRAPMELRRRLDADPSLAGDYVFSEHNYKILISLREDFLPELEALQDQISDLALNRFRLRRLNGHAALQVVNQASHLIDKPMAEAIVRFVAKAGGKDKALNDFEIEPALLSIICRELNNRRQLRGQEKITKSLLQDSEAEILRDFYERSISGLSFEVRTFIEEHLLTVTGYRDSIALENVLTLPGLSRESISQLENRRLVRVDTKSGRERVELTHDLITGVIRSSRDKRRLAESEREAVEREKIVSRKLRKSRYITAACLMLLFISAAIGYCYGVESRKMLKNEKISNNSLATTNDEVEELSDKIKVLSEQRVVEIKALKTLLEIRDKQISGLRSAIGSLDPEAMARIPEIDFLPSASAERDAKSAADEAADLAAITANQIGKQEKKVKDAQLKYHESFEINVQFKFEMAKTAFSSRIDSLLSGLGFTADASKFTFIGTIERNEVLYFEGYAEKEATLIAKKLRPLVGDFGVELVQTSNSGRNITIRIATPP